MTNIWTSNNGIVDGLVENDLLNQTLETSLLEVKAYLKQFSTTPEFIEKMQLSFGKGFDVGVAKNLAQSWASGDFDAMPGIEILNSDTLKGANGAFSIDTNTIYLSREYLSSSNVQAVSDVLLEEIGHFVDSRINSTDAAGDEGAIFSSLVRGESLTTETLAQLGVENDAEVISLNGQAIAIEQSAPPPGVIEALQYKEFYIAGNPAKWTNKTITYNFMPVFPLEYQLAINLTATTLGSLAGSVGALAGAGVGILASLLAANKFVAFNNAQKSSTKLALGLWSEIADVTFKEENDTRLELSDILDLNLLGGVLKGERETITEIKDPITGLPIIDLLTGFPSTKIIKTVFDFQNRFNDFIDDEIGKLIGFPITDGADIRFGMFNNSITNGSGFAIPPFASSLTEIGQIRQKIANGIDDFLNTLPLIDTIPGINAVRALNNAKLGVIGDVWLNTNSSTGVDFNQLSPGSFGFETILHEIGHALGLKHPSAADASGFIPTPKPFLDNILPGTDNLRYTIMSYNEGKGQGSVSPSTPMLYDIAAIQSLYGANSNTRSGNTTYSWNADLPFMQTIWDTGGIDTIDASNQKQWKNINSELNQITLDERIQLTGDAQSNPNNHSGVEIYLEAGKFSSIGSTKIEYSNAPTKIVKAGYNLAIAFGVTIENAIGSAFDDYIVGNDVANTIKGGNGNDSLKGGKGNDNLEGGNGNDVLDGEVGADTLKGGTGDDTYIVENVSDTIIENFNEGTDTVKSSVTHTLSANVENLTLTGSANINGTGNNLDNTIIGNSGKNTLKGNAGKDKLYGGKGDDLLEGGTGNDSLYGEDGKDLLFGEADNDLLDGGNDEDRLYGGLGNDSLYGGFGNDILAGQEGNDSLFGEDGNDIIAGGTDNDYLDGGDGNDCLYGQQGFDNLDGGQGNDFLAGGEDDDFLYGSDGNDSLYGQEGNDYLDGGIGNDELFGGQGDDQLYGQKDIDYLYGGDGNDFIWGNEDNDRLFGQKGNDYLDGGIGNDELFGGQGNDQLYGQSGDDRLYGGDGDDYLEGGQGNDQLYGQSGDNTLIGGLGQDSLYGGIGQDTFELSLATGKDFIFDFVKGQDFIQLIDGLTFANLQIFQGKGADATDTFIKAQSGDDILAVLDEVQASTINRFDFITSA